MHFKAQNISKFVASICETRDNKDSGIFSYLTAIRHCDKTVEDTVSKNSGFRKSTSEHSWLISHAVWAGKEKKDIFRPVINRQAFLSVYATYSKQSQDLRS